MPTAEYIIIGMTCDHCVQAVQEELDKISPQIQYEINRNSGALKINSESPISRETVAAAIDEAGYTLES